MNGGNKQQPRMLSKNIKMDYSKLMQLSVDELLNEAVERAKLIYLVKDEVYKKNVAILMSAYYTIDRIKIKDAVLEECIFDLMDGELHKIDSQLKDSFLQKKWAFYKCLRMMHLKDEAERQKTHKGLIYSPKQLAMTESVISMSLGDLSYYKKKIDNINNGEIRLDYLDSASLLLNGKHSSFTVDDSFRYKKLTDPRDEVIASIDLNRPDSEILSSLKSLLPLWRKALKITPQDGVARERNAPGKAILKKIITNKLIEFMDQIIFDILDGRERTKKEIANTIFDNPTDDFINKTIMNSIKQLSCDDYAEKAFSYIKSEGFSNKTVAEFMSE